MFSTNSATSSQVQPVTQNLPQAAEAPSSAAQPLATAQAILQAPPSAASAPLPPVQLLSPSNSAAAAPPQEASEDVSFSAHLDAFLAAHPTPEPVASTAQPSQTVAAAAPSTTSADPLLSTPDSKGRSPIEILDEIEALQQEANAALNALRKDLNQLEVQRKSLASLSEVSLTPEFAAKRLYLLKKAKRLASLEKDPTPQVVVSQFDAMELLLDKMGAALATLTRFSLTKAQNQDRSFLSTQGKRGEKLKKCHREIAIAITGMRKSISSYYKIHDLDPVIVAQKKMAKKPT